MTINQWEDCIFVFGFPFAIFIAIVFGVLIVWYLRSIRNDARLNITHYKNKVRIKDRSIK